MEGEAIFSIRSSIFIGIVFTQRVAFYYFLSIYIFIYPFYFVTGFMAVLFIGNMRVFMFNFYFACFRHWVLYSGSI